MGTTNDRKFAIKISKLGTETAYAVSGEAQQLAKNGLKIYPFHIGEFKFSYSSMYSKKVKIVINNYYNYLIKKKK